MYPLVNNVPPPLVHARSKFVALQLAVEIMHGPSLASQTQPTPAWISFSITHGDTESDPRWGWFGLACETSMERQQHDPQTEMKRISLGFI